MEDIADMDLSARYDLICLRMRARAIHVGSGLHNPTVTEEQLRDAEALLGFRLPELLRRLFTTVANGAEFFGHGYPIYGIRDERHEEFMYLGIIEGIENGGERLDKETVAALRASPGAYVACDRTPSDFVSLAFLGCSVGLWLDGPTGMLFSSDTVLGDDGEEMIGLSYHSASVDEWLERSLDESPFRGGNPPRQPIFPLSQAESHEAAHRQKDDSATSLWVAPEQERMNRQGQRLRHTRAEIVGLLYEAADVEDVVAAEVGMEQADEVGFGAPLQALVDAEAQLYELERLLTSGILLHNARTARMWPNVT